jgi:hypothetical protein
MNSIYMSTVAHVVQLLTSAAGLPEIKNTLAVINAERSRRSSS